MSRSVIVQAAATEFARLGYHRTSMDEIAKAAGVAKGTLYYHFTSKAQLFKALVTEGLAMIQGKVQGALRSGMPVEAQLRAVIRSHLDLYLEYKELAVILLNEMSAGLDEEVLGETKELLRQYIRFIAELIGQGRQAGLVAEVNRELAASGLIGMLDGVCKYYLSNQADISRGEMEQFMYRMVMGGLFDRKH